MFEIYGLLFGVLVAFTKPSYFAILLNLIGIHKTTFFAEEGLKSLSQEIENAVINSYPKAFDSFLTLSARGKHSSEGGPQYALDDNTFLRWYCKCHGLQRLSLSLCLEEGSGILCLIYHREQTHSFQQGLMNPASWQIIGPHSPRTVFVKAMSKSHGDRSYIQIYKPHGSLRRKAIPWKGALPIPVCAVDAIVLKEELREAIITRINRFIKIGPRCLEVGVRHQLGMLFLGPKGTGKSSFIHILARKYGFPIYDFDIGNPTLEDSDLIAMCDAMEPNAIAVFDDIDRVGVGGRGVTEAGLLKAFDGAKMQNQGRLLIATANDREKVPEALLRKGRIDKEYLFSKASEAQLKGLFLRTHVWLEKETKGHDLNMLAEAFSLKVTSDTYPPAAITSYLKGVAGPKEAIANIADIGVTVS